MPLGHTSRKWGTAIKNADGSVAADHKSSGVHVGEDADLVEHRDDPIPLFAGLLDDVVRRLQLDRLGLGLVVIDSIGSDSFQ
jgi:hypothetical protein